MFHRKTKDHQNQPLAEVDAWRGLCNTLRFSLPVPIEKSVERSKIGSYFLCGTGHRADGLLM